MAKTENYTSLRDQQKVLEAQIVPFQRQRFAELRARRTEIEAELAPLQAELESLDITRRREMEVRDLIKVARTPLVEVDAEIAEISRSLADKKTGKAVTAIVSE